MYYNFRNLPVSINGNTIFANNIELSNAIDLIHPLNYTEQSSEKNVINSNPTSNLKLTYYLTGADLLKNYIYTDGGYWFDDGTTTTNSQALSANIAGITFNQGYIRDYNISISPDSNIEVNTNIVFFDSPNGSVTSMSPSIFTGHTLKVYDAKINNYTNYTTNLLNQIASLSFNYQANIDPSYKITDPSISPTRADRVSYREREISMDIVSDDVNLTLPLSGENFGIKVYLVNPYNTGIRETLECSGKISNKSMRISANDTHLHRIQISQSHLNSESNITGVITGYNSSLLNFAIRFTENTRPITSSNGINYVSRVKVGNVDIIEKLNGVGTYGYEVNRQPTYDEIVVSPPSTIINGILNVETTRKNYIYPSSIIFSPTAITISSLTSAEDTRSTVISGGKYGLPIYINGTNFYNITDVYFRDKRANFRTRNITQILATVPYGEVTGPIKVISTTRNQTGTYNQLFFGLPYIESINPNTGIWNDLIVLSGYNLSGTTGIYFGNIRASGFTINNNNKITTYSPQTGSGYAYGYITILGSGESSQSIIEYQSYLPILDFIPTSGRVGSGVNIRFSKLDTGYLCPSGSGYKINFGEIDTVFYISGDSNLTGKIPDGAKDGYIYTYRPDGNLLYNTYTGLFDVISYPIITNISPQTIKKYTYNLLKFYGQYIKNFDNTSYLRISGVSDTNTGYIKTINYNTDTTISGNAFDFNGLNTLIEIKNITITGNTGTYLIELYNKDGKCTINNPYIELISGINLLQTTGRGGDNKRPSNVSITGISMWWSRSDYIKTSYNIFDIYGQSRRNTTNKYIGSALDPQFTKINDTKYIGGLYNIVDTGNGDKGIRNYSGYINNRYYIADNNKSGFYISIKPQRATSAGAMFLSYHVCNIRNTVASINGITGISTGTIAIWGGEPTRRHFFIQDYNLLQNTVSSGLVDGGTAANGTGYTAFLPFGHQIEPIKEIRIYAPNSDSNPKLTFLPTHLELY